MCTKMASSIYLGRVEHFESMNIQDTVAIRNADIANNIWFGTFSLL